MHVRFKKIKLGKRYHPNSIKIVVKGENEDSIYVIAESVGGGDIVIREIMGFKTEITGSNVTIILRHSDLVGSLSKITGAISSFNLNILTIRSKDIPKKEEALTTIEIEEKAPKELEAELKKIKGMKMVRILPSLTEGEEMF